MLRLPLPRPLRAAVLLPALSLLAIAPDIRAQAVNGALQTKGVASLFAGTNTASSQPDQAVQGILSLSVAAPQPQAAFSSLLAEELTPMRLRMTRTSFAQPSPTGTSVVTGVGLVTAETADFLATFTSDSSPVTGTVRVTVSNTASGGAGGVVKIFFQNNVQNVLPNTTATTLTFPGVVADANGLDLEVMFGGVAPALGGQSSTLTQVAEVEFIPANSQSLRCTVTPDRASCQEGGILLANSAVSGAQEILQTTLGSGPTGGIAFAYITPAPIYTPLGAAIPSLPTATGCIAVTDPLAPFSPQTIVLYGVLGPQGSASRNFTIGSFQGSLTFQLVTLGMDGRLASSNSLRLDCP